ncbi:hypothetical protein PIROE2DRAFT_18834 [Piromyces sp. E2]|nr:hypothetical protein PIROE2DRAFT_18834 [Piromyces sp. E2]|eukprot:OUM56526.1 hypothetical protein PIROE2DRAFT_18834 [Piromyces sp. E2]
MIYRDLSYNDIKELPEFLNAINLKEFDISYNYNLSGKTLINKNISSCRFYETKLCIADEKTPCLTSIYDLQPCEIIPTECDEIDSYLKEKNIDVEEAGFYCSVDSDKKVDYLNIKEQEISEEVLDKILSYNSTTEIKISVDNSKNALTKIGQNLPNLKKLTIQNSVKSLNLKVLKKLKSLSYL